ncbi:DUF4336-containing protein [Aureococcus anophagefferens]|nr:DUF4336-containing protein [Aureococcus anophagefferens]
MIGIYYVHVPIRMTVVKLRRGGLFVYAPVAATDECLALLKELTDAHGPVKHIVLPSVAVEHKPLPRSSKDGNPFGDDFDFDVLTVKPGPGSYYQDATFRVADTPENRRKGWRRIVLLFNFFFPGAATPDLGLKPLLALGPFEPYGWRGWKPFEWKSEAKERRAFEAFAQNGKPTILPIIQIILARGDSGAATAAWVSRVSTYSDQPHLRSPPADSYKAR